VLKTDGSDDDEVDVAGWMSGRRFNSAGESSAGFILEEAMV